MVKINLLAEGKRPIIARRAKQPLLQLSGANAANIALTAVAVASLLAATTWYFLLERNIKRKAAEIAVAQKEVDELQQVIKEVEEFKRRRDELTRKVQIITDLKNNQRGPVQIMDEVSRALPELLWLTRMDVSASAINFYGTAMNMSAVANFIENLDRVEPFREPILQDTTRGRAGGSYNFRMTMGYSFTKPVAPAAPGAAKAAAPVPPKRASASPGGTAGATPAVQAANMGGVE
jgi:type IV pilus assembly protein PilN